MMYNGFTVIFSLCENRLTCTGFTVTFERLFQYSSAQMVAIFKRHSNFEHADKIHGKSWCAGMATQLAADGCQLRVVMDWGGWKTASRCMLYTREVPHSEFWREFYFFLGRNFAALDRIGWGARGHDQ